jgi:hypothetical protein
MNDPLATLIRGIYGMLDFGPGTVVLEISAALMLACLFLPNLLQSRSRQREAILARECRALTARIDSLLPIYRQTLREYVDRFSDTVTSNDAVVRLAKQIPDEVKSKGERDFCLIDAKDGPESGRIQLLQMEASNMFRKQE